MNDLRRSGSGEFYFPHFGRLIRKDKAAVEAVEHSCTVLHLGHFGAEKQLTHGHL